MEHGNNEDKKCCCCERKKQRQEKEYKDLVNRLSRIEGYPDAGISGQCSFEQL